MRPGAVCGGTRSMRVHQCGQGHGGSLFREHPRRDLNPHLAHRAGPTKRCVRRPRGYRLRVHQWRHLHPAPTNSAQQRQNGFATRLSGRTCSRSRHRRVALDGAVPVRFQRRDLPTRGCHRLEVGTDAWSSARDARCERVAGVPSSWGLLALPVRGQVSRPCGGLLSIPTWARAEQ